LEEDQRSVRSRLWTMSVLSPPESVTPSSGSPECVENGDEFQSMLGEAWGVGDQVKLLLLLLITANSVVQDCEIPNQSIIHAIHGGTLGLSVDATTVPLSKIALNDDLVWEFARILKDTLRRLLLTIPDMPFNYYIHTSPINTKNEYRYYHWHLEIMPRLSKPAGFEWGTGFYINPMPPEKAAAILREK